MTESLFDDSQALVDLAELPPGINWFNKLTIEFIEEKNGSGSVNIEWDETDPELEAWTNLGAEKQKAFIIQALTNAIDSALTTDVV